ncbi:MAG: DNA helicase II, partial [Gammaproteobacteria bacterium]
FIDEIPGELIDEVRPRPGISRPRAAFGSTPDTVPDTAPGGLRLGQHVRHAKFGDGVITGCEGQGGNARVQVNFSRAGSKWLVLAYANLEAVGA